jgi:hypothetical protein
MSFTEDELQSFNTILERRLSAHRQEMERAFEQRLSALARDLEQRLVLLQQELARTLTHKLNDQQNELNLALSQKLGTQQSRLTQALGHEIEQRQQQQQQQIEHTIDRLLAAQLMGIEQLLTQRLPSPPEGASDEGETSRAGSSEQAGESPAPEPIEVQTDLSWDDLMEIIGKALDERLGRLSDSLQALVRSWEQQLAMQRSSSNAVEPYRNGQGALQQVYQSIERLEQIVESLQVAMTANHALLSNRLYHHQHLPLERAHPSSRPTPGSTSPTTRVSLEEEPDEEGLHRE